MLSHLCPSGCGSASSPAVYTPPVPYPDPSIPTTFSTLVSPAEKTWLQQVVGSLLFYARALDLSILTAVCQLSSHQSNPTQHDLSSAHRLLNYVSSHRDRDPSSYTLVPLLYHPQRSPPCPLPAHTRGGSVCGRGGVRFRFWRWASVG